MVEAETRGRPGRNVGILAAAQAFAGTGQTMVVTASALTGQMLAPDPALATLAMALQFTATALTSIPASLLMGRVGRRPGFLLGAAAQAIGALVSVAAIVSASFPLFCLGGFLLGVANSFTMFYRFAAADAVGEAERSRAIGFVLTGGMVAALVGPNLAGAARDWLQPYLFAGIYLAVAALSVANAGVLTGLRIPRPAAESRRGGRPMAEIVGQPTFVVAVIGALIAYGIMTLLMTATPLAMAACGHDFSSAAFVIQWHALGMYAPSFVTGAVIRRLGAPRVMQVGVALLLASVLTSLSGTEVMRFWGGLLLLGLGWNALFVGATALLTQACRPAEKAKVQALNDFLVFGTSAAASFSAGPLNYHVGWAAVNYGVLPLLAVVTAGLLYLKLARRPVTA